MNDGILGLLIYVFLGIPTVLIAGLGTMYLVWAIGNRIFLEDPDAKDPQK